MKPRILIVYTGGTIGMIEDAATKALRPFDFSHLMENVPKVKKLDYVIDNIQFQTPIDSSDMDITHWQSIVRSIADNYDNYDGFVVLHGTDTMAYTASALSFMLQNLRKPVIITGSQLPIGEVRTDGEENLITALQIAASLPCERLPYCSRTICGEATGRQNGAPTTSTLSAATTIPNWQKSDWEYISAAPLSPIPTKAEDWKSTPRWTPM